MNTSMGGMQQNKLSNKRDLKWKYELFVSDAL